MKSKLNINKLLTSIIVIFLFPSLFSCQPIEILDDVVFDNNLLTKISINAEQRYINNIYEINYVDPYIDHSMKYPPLLRINNWLEQNINVFGSQNKLIINIIEASLIRNERKNENRKQYEEKTEFYYEMHYMIEFVLQDDNDLILATTIVEAMHSTTSGKFISLNEKEKIVDTLILETLIDVSSKSKELLKKHMFEFML